MDAPALLAYGHAAALRQLSDHAGAILQGLHHGARSLFRLSDDATKDQVKLVRSLRGRLRDMAVANHWCRKVSKVKVDSLLADLSNVLRLIEDGTIPTCARYEVHANDVPLVTKADMSTQDEAPEAEPEDERSASHTSEARDSDVSDDEAHTMDALRRRVAYLEALVREDIVATSQPFDAAAQTEPSLPAGGEQVLLCCGPGEVYDIAVGKLAENVASAHERLRAAVSACETRADSADPDHVLDEYASDTTWAAENAQADACWKVRTLAHTVEQLMYDLAWHEAEVNDDFTPMQALPRRFLSRYWCSDDEFEVAAYLDVADGRFPAHSR